jgi:arylmalonate decarboxylase
MDDQSGPRIAAEQDNILSILRLNRPYGWRGKIGLITPSPNNVNEPEWARLVPPGVAIHTSRVLLSGPMTLESYNDMARDLTRAARELSHAECDIVAFGCTSGSFLCPIEQLTASISERTGTPAIVTAGAVVMALRKLGVRKIAMATPYLDYVNKREVEFLQGYGFEVTRCHGLNLGHNHAERRSMGHIPPQAFYRLASEIDSPDAEAIFLSCANIATIDVIEDIEKALGKPVVTSNVGCLWACLRILGINSSVAGYGRLMRDLTQSLTKQEWQLKS